MVLSQIEQSPPPAPPVGGISVVLVPARLIPDADMV